MTPTEQALEAVKKLKDRCGNVLVDKYDNDWKAIEAALQPQTVDVEALIYDAFHNMSLHPEKYETFGKMKDYVLEIIKSQGVLNTGWQTIDSAPKDGKAVLLYEHGDEASFEGYYDTYNDLWCLQGQHPTDYYYVDINPKGWMPLPTPPKQEGE